MGNMIDLPRSTPRTLIEVAGHPEPLAHLASRVRDLLFARAQPLLIVLFGILVRVTDKAFAIHTQHRPRRIAFLVDLNQSVATEILDSILDFNLGSWGGRHNPILPLVGGSVPNTFYPLLDVADPDVFYFYGDVSDSILEEIHHRYLPTFIYRHVAREPLDSRSYSVQLLEQAGLRRFLVNLRERIPLHFRQPEPCLLQLEIPQRQALSRFFMWNFGYTSANFFAIQNHGVPGCRPASIEDHDLLELFSKQMNLAWPIHACADAPLARTSGESSRHHLPIYYGESPWNLLAYWNDGLVTGRSIPTRAGINQIWLTRATLDNEATYRQFVQLLRRRVYSDNHQKALKMISYDTSEEELETTAKKLVQDIQGRLYYGGYLKLTAPNIEVGQPQRVNSFPATRGQVDYATGREIHLEFKCPVEVEENTDQCWMVDVHIYNTNQELWYSNATTWWRLPRNSSIAGLFGGRPQRITVDRRVSFEVGARENMLDFEIPSETKLFRYLLSPRIHYHLAADQRSHLPTQDHFQLRRSEKGRYLSGILALSQSLKETLYLFEHRFWRSLLRRLSRAEPSKHLMAKLETDIEKLLRNFKASDLAATKVWLREELLFAAKQLSKAAIWLPYANIHELYTEHVDALSDDEKDMETRDLKGDISGLTRDGLLFQGAELRCPNCISAFWYSVEEIRKNIICRGCHVAFPLPAETEWSYQLNELVRAGISEHGLLPVLRTLTRLYDDAHDCFFFSPSVDFMTDPDTGNPTVERELDLAWVKDGRFGIAEVKTSTKLFKPSDYQDIAALARRIRPDILLIAAPEGNDQELAKGKQALNDELKGTMDVWAWGPTEFARAPRWTQF